MSTLIDRLVTDYYANGTHQRLGQYFINTYIKCEDDATKGMWSASFNDARVLIAQFMMSNQWYQLPKKLSNLQPTASRFIGKE